MREIVFLLYSRELRENFPRLVLQFDKLSREASYSFPLPLLRIYFPLIK